MIIYIPLLRQVKSEIKLYLCCGLYIIQSYPLRMDVMFIYKSKAVKKFKTKSALARYLGITKQAVQAWPDRKPIPQKHAIKLVSEFGEEAFK